MIKILSLKIMFGLKKGEDKKSEMEGKWEETSGEK